MKNVLCKIEGVLMFLIFPHPNKMIDAEFGRRFGKWNGVRSETSEIDRKVRIQTCPIAVQESSGCPGVQGPSKKINPTNNMLSLIIYELHFSLNMLVCRFRESLS